MQEDDQERLAEDGGEPERRSPQADERRPLWKNRFLNFVIEIAVLFIIALVIAIYTQAFVVKAYEIPSPSMEPTLKGGHEKDKNDPEPNDRILVDRATYHFREPRRGEVIVFRFNPNDIANWTQGSNGFVRCLDLLAEMLNLTHQDSLPYIKRVIGLPGETVEVKEGGDVYIDGELLDESGYTVVKGGPEGRWTVPQGTVMVMGDNRPNSFDSRRWGFVPYQAIIGRAVFIWWPLSRWGAIK
jgi:signal peptidase I